MRKEIHTPDHLKGFIDMEQGTVHIEDQPELSAADVRYVEFSIDFLNDRVSFTYRIRGKSAGSQP